MHTFLLTIVIKGTINNDMAVIRIALHIYEYNMYDN